MFKLKSPVISLILFFIFVFFQIKRMMDEYTYGIAAKFDPNSRMLARRVDKVARRLFPSAFICFNVFYWCWFTLR